MGINRKGFLKFLGVGSVGLVLLSGLLPSGSGLLSRPVKIYDNISWKKNGVRNTAMP